MQQQQRRIFTRDEIYQKLVAALTDKQPLPPAGWCASQLDEELWRVTKEYEPDARLRQKDSLETCLNYLVDYAVRMPERVNLTESNIRAKQMCEELADEIEKITFAPNEIIRERGKLKSWLKAILSVQTCLIYREETERFIAEQDALRRAARLLAPKQTKFVAAQPKAEKWQWDLAKNIFQKVAGKSPAAPPAQSSEQPSLF
jgi:hypothetical protein